MNATTAAGSALAISATLPSNEDAAGYDGLPFVDVGNLEKIGSLGATYSKSEFQPLRGRKLKFKGSPDFGALSPTLAINDDDAGQDLMRVASDDRTGRLYAFRVTYPNGARRWFLGQVFGMPETVDSADVVLMAAPTVEICSEIVRGAPASDNVPNDFSFAPKTGVAADADISSDPVQITGINVPTPISGGPYSVNGGAFISGTGTINPNDFVRAQVHSPAVASTEAGASVTIGGITRSFKVTTAAAQVGAAPANTLAPTVSGMAQDGQTLSVTNGTWTGSPTGYAYQWFSNATSSTTGGTAISGATAAALVLSTSLVGLFVYCRVTAANAAGSDAAPSNITAAVATTGTPTYDVNLPQTSLVYTGVDANGFPLFDYFRPASVLENDQLELARAVLPTFAGAQLERHTVPTAEGAPLGYALLNTQSFFVWRARFWRANSYGPWCDLATNDTRLPVVTGGGTQAAPTATSATEGAFFGPVFTANKPVKWALVGTNASLFTAPVNYTDTFDLADYLTDYESGVATIDVGVVATDLLGQVSDGSGSWVHHTVVNDPADDPILPATFPTTNGVNKSQYVNVNGLVVSMNRDDVGALAGVRASQQPRADYTRFEVLLNTGQVNAGNPTVIALDDGTINLGSYPAPLPGKDGNVGLHLRIGPGSTYLYANSQTPADGLPSLQAGDIVGVNIRKSTGLVSFDRTRTVSGTTTTVPIASATIALANWFAILGQFATATATANFHGPFAGPLASGQVSYGN